MNATGNGEGGPPPGAEGGGPPRGPPRPSFTEAQISALHNVPRVTAALSLIGSCLIIYMIFKSSRHRLKNTQNRFLFAISAVDIPFSIMFVLGTIMVPSRLPFDNTYGNVQTCNLQGFFIQLGYAQPLYNAYLMAYYALIVCAGVKEERFSKLYEPWMHVFAVLFSLGTAIAGLPTEIYNPSIVGRCSINAFPPGCASNPNIECQRGGENHRAFRWAFNLGPTLAALAVMFAALAWLCFYVTFRERESQKQSSRRISHFTTASSTRQSRRTLRTFLSSATYANKVSARALMYAVIFFNTYAWITIANMIRVVAHEPPPYWLVLTGNIFQPCQGFFTFFVYILPRYAAVRRRYNEWPWYRVFCYAIQKGTADLPSRRNVATAMSSRFSDEMSRHSSRRILSRQGNSSMELDRSKPESISTNGHVLAEGVASKDDTDQNGHSGVSDPIFATVKADPDQPDTDQQAASEGTIGDADRHNETVVSFAELPTVDQQAMSESRDGNWDGSERIESPHLNEDFV